MDQFIVKDILLFFELSKHDKCFVVGVKEVMEF